MREIKFRVWHKKRKKYYPVHHLHIDTIGVPDNPKEWATCKAFDCIEQKDIYIQVQPKDGMLEQYTGLKDATKWEDLTEKERSDWTRKCNLPSEWEGKEIYEGDILFIESCFGLETFKVPVIYKDGCFQAEGSGILSFVCSLNTPKIISNIHENKELA